MTEPNPYTLGYATLPEEDAALPRWLRRVVEWGAIAYGGGSSLARVYFLAISRKWIDAGIEFGTFTALEDAFEWAHAGASVVLCVAGVLVLRNPGVGVVAVRVGAGLSLLMVGVEQLYVIVWDQLPDHYLAHHVLSALTSATQPVLLIALTLGPLGRTLRRV